MRLIVSFAFMAREARGGTAGQDPAGIPAPCLRRGRAVVSRGLGIG